jgi:hypothetical protein
VRGEAASAVPTRKLSIRTLHPNQVNQMRMSEPGKEESKQAGLPVA